MAHYLLKLKKAKSMDAGCGVDLSITAFTDAVVKWDQFTSSSRIKYNVEPITELYIKNFGVLWEVNKIIVIDLL